MGVVVVAPSWWWGVVFDLWIVVASIKPHSVSLARFFRVDGGVVFCGVIFFSFFWFFVL